MDTSEKREPLLSDIEKFGMAVSVDPSREFHTHKSPHEAASNVRDFYEAKIASGELRVVKKVRPEWSEYHTWQCPHCFQQWHEHNSPDVGEFCLCGAQIIE